MGALTRLIGFLRPYVWRAAAAALALVVAAGSVLVLGQGLRLVVDEGFMAGQPGMLDRALALTLGVIAVMAVASALRFYLVTWIGERVAADLRHAVLSHLLSLEPDFYERNGVGEIQSRVTTDTALLQTVLGSTFSMAVRNVLLLAGTLVMLVVTSPRLTALVLLGLPLVLLPMLIFGRRVRRLSRLSQDRIAELGSYAGETLSGIATVQAFGHEAEDRRRFDSLVEQAFATAGARIRQRAWLNGVALSLAFTAVGVILWQGGHDVLAGRMSAGELSAFVFYAVLAAGSVGVISEVAGEVMRAAGAAERLFELLDAQPAIAAPPQPKPLPTPPRGAVSIDGVRFAYPSRPRTPALDGISLEIRPGERLALVGPSGAGKSTLFALLLRFHDPQAGAIRFDGVDLRAADPAALRARIALVAQEPLLFTGSAADNIRFGRPDADDGAIRAAAAHCTEFVEALPEGFDTWLGPGGIQLSGGQRQRIAIARAILRDPALLLLDEATSSLDAESERQVQHALERLMAGRTSIVIAHRLATVTAADRIAVLEQGRLRAVDSHHRLLERDPLYARLAALQLREPRQPAANERLGNA
ncbi:ABC transporter [Spiribacter halobius]|uniref:ABC transporter n=1 Tax=Sediminicurvatus halobius TaxID=2182432 RepID=A0A2U2MZX5_9GAMM|nr:ABC transporter [Spiribacter halobius]